MGGHSSGRSSGPAAWGVVAGRRSSVVVLAVWLAAVAAVFPLSSALDELLRDDPASYLPRGAESVAILERLEAFPGGASTPAAVVLWRDSGLDPEDLGAVEELRAELQAGTWAGTSGPMTVADDGTTALLEVPVRAGDDIQQLLAAVADLRGRAAAVAGRTGLEAAVTGPAGNRADLDAAFAGVDGTLLLATAVLVLVLLVVIYRSPVFWLIPFLASAFAIVGARAAAWGLGTLGVTINEQSANILPVLVFGAGTDYALLLVARYREELRRHPDRHRAMRAALRSAGPAVVASGGTTVVALLTLTLARLAGTVGLAIVGAAGLAVTVLAMVTVLPALLLLVGRPVFWPFIPRPGDTGSDEAHGPWRRAGERVARRPRAPGSRPRSRWGSRHWGWEG